MLVKNKSCSYSNLLSYIKSNFGYIYFAQTRGRCDLHIQKSEQPLDTKSNSFPNRKPRGYWENEENINKYLLKLKENNNVQKPEDWDKKITIRKIKSTGGGSLLYKNRLNELKSKLFPNIKINKNIKKPTGYWENENNIIQFLKNIGKVENLISVEDWNKLSAKLIIHHGGGYLLKKYSLFQLKILACNEIQEKFEKYQIKPKGYWKQENIENFIIEIKKKFNFNSIDDWNLLSTKHIKSCGGITLLKKYSLYDIKLIACPEIKDIYPNISNNKPKGYWDNFINVENFMVMLKSNLHLTFS